MWHKLAALVSAVAPLPRSAVRPSKTLEILASRHSARHFVQSGLAFTIGSRWSASLWVTRNAHSQVLECDELDKSVHKSKSHRGDSYS